MRKSIFAALALTGALVLGPAGAQAAPVEPYHAGHDHGAKPEKSKPKPKSGKPKPKPKKGSKQKAHGDGAHAGGGYDSHRSHDGPEEEN